MKRVHLYTLPKDTALPSDTSAIPDGYPYVAGEVLHFLIKGPNGDGSDDVWERLLANRIAAGSSQTVSARSSVVGCTSAGITVTLASSMLADGAWIDVVDEAGGAAANPITVATEGSETIDGATTLTIDADYGQVRLYSDGSNWFTRSVDTHGQLSGVSAGDHHSNANDPTADEKDALAGTGTPSSSNLYTTEDTHDAHATDGTNPHDVTADQAGAVGTGDLELGNAVFDGDGSTTTFTVTHGLGTAPKQAFVQPASVDARDNGPALVTNKTSTGFDVVLPAAPPSGTGNVEWDYQVWLDPNST